MTTDRLETMLIRLRAAVEKNKELHNLDPVKYPFDKIERVRKDIEQLDAVISSTPSESRATIETLLFDEDLPLIGWLNRLLDEHYADGS